MKSFVLIFSTPDRAGIEANVSNFLYENGAFLNDVQSYSDFESKLFFSRIVFQADIDDSSASQLIAKLNVIAKKLNMKFILKSSQKKMKIIVAVSGEGHCLNDLLYRAKFKENQYEIVGVISNHETFKEIVEQNGIKFFYLPISESSNSREQQEDAFNKVAVDLGAELIVLARYMQILSENFVSKWKNKCINIHHSFLPSFKGAKPYHQAFEKGVKIIGATAHYVTKDLDEGPIIEQDVDRVMQRDTITDIIRKGNDIESRVLANAVRWHSENKIIINGNKTIVFS